MDDDMPAFGAPSEPSPSAKLMAAVELRKLASQYEVFRSERMRLVAEGIRLAAELIDPESA